MKTLGRALIILSVFALIMGITYAVVTAGTSGSSAPQFQRGNNGFAGQPNFANGQRPEFPGGERNGLRRARGDGLMFGMIKNIFVIGIVVAVIVVSKGWMQKRRRTAQATG